MRLRLLGGLEIEPSGDTPRKTKLVLAAVALASTKGISRAQLCAMFWPDRAVPQARSSLRQALTALRRLGSEQGGPISAIDGDLETVRL